MKNLVIIGSSGAIGNAFTHQLATLYPSALIWAFSHSMPKIQLPNVTSHSIDYQNESTIEASALLASKDVPIDLVIVATGILHTANIQPEKSLKALSSENLMTIYQANTIFPALVAKHFIPKLNHEHRSVFAALSARVGSISDNHLGGWYAYRASKAALNMIIKNAAIETARINKQAVIVGLHPGTVDSHLSQPFQSNVPEEKLFTAEYSVKHLLEVLKQLSPEQSGRCFAWDGQEVLP